MIQNSGVKDKSLEKCIYDVNEKCNTCKKFAKPSPRPVVSTAMAQNFNDIVAIDLKAFDGKYFLVMVDLFTKYCSAAVIVDKKPSTIIENMFQYWIAIFGAPARCLSDNGGEFSNWEFMEFSEAFNIKHMTTAAESPWSNGVCERLNSILGSSVRKVLSDCGCSLRVALAWAVSARNALTTYSGYSPNQLVFGFNPALPSTDNNRLSSMGRDYGSEMVRKNLNAMHSARSEFIRIESDKKLQRAMVANVRESKDSDTPLGCEVYY